MVTAIDTISLCDTVGVDTLNVDTLKVDTLNYQQRRAVTVRKSNIIQGELDAIQDKLDSILIKLEKK